MIGWRGLKFSFIAGKSDIEWRMDWWRKGPENAPDMDFPELAVS